MSKLILLNGPLASGKSTLSREYAKLNPMTLALDIDHIWFMISDWRNNWEESLQLTKKMVFDMACTYLQSGHDVIIPFLIHNQHDYDSIKHISKISQAQFTEVCIDIPLEDAIEKYLKRSAEKGKPEGYVPNTTQDISSKKKRFIKLYNDMVKLHSSRLYTLKFTPTNNDIQNDAIKLNNLINKL